MGINNPGVILLEAVQIDTNFKNESDLAAPNRNHKNIHSL